MIIHPNVVAYFKHIDKYLGFSSLKRILTQVLRTIVPTLPGREDIAWLNKEILLSSDGSRLFYFDVSTNKGWQLVPIENNNLPIKGISRLAVNTRNTKVAVVVSE